MTAWTRRIPFKVDVAGVIHIMGTALYSRPEAAVRELIQNAHDAVMRRRRRDLSFRGRIEVRQDAEAGILEFADDGFGITVDEAERFLGTLGIGITGILKGRYTSTDYARGDDDGLIGMFGIGLFSSFMLADQVVVESRSYAGGEPVRWSAGAGSDIELSSGTRESVGTTVRLTLKSEYRRLAVDSDLLEKIIKSYAEFLTIPIFLNDAAARTNVIRATWFDPTPEQEALELDLAGYFGETPLDVIPVQISPPGDIQGALYVSPQRVPGFSGDAVVTATVLRMVVSRDIRGLLPDWASFLRGVLELRGCSPTASREDLQRDGAFQAAREALEDYLLHHFEKLAQTEPQRFEAVLAWHRYAWCGAALTHARLRNILRSSYKFPTSQGLLTFEEILRRSSADPIYETEFEQVVWYNTERAQEAWINSLFHGHEAPCVHALRSFEESLLAALVGDVGGGVADLRFAAPASPHFAEQILGVRELEDAPPEWQDHLSDAGAVIRCASFRADQPVMTFLNEQHELANTFADLKKQGAVPTGFQRLIDAHFSGESGRRNEVLLNREHRLVARALEQSTAAPLAGVLRMLVLNALTTVGAKISGEAHRRRADDLDWIAECLWGKS
ncbi:MAG: ATP-binding protein [Planctomycetales bacterium]|nr:ATP-binding protein [Planctomycetales bacterium]